MITRVKAQPHPCRRAAGALSAALSASVLVLGEAAAAAHATSLGGEERRAWEGEGEGEEGSQQGRREGRRGSGHATSS